MGLYHLLHLSGKGRIYKNSEKLKDKVDGVNDSVPQSEREVIRTLPPEDRFNTIPGGLCYP